jgi:predicted DNA-binding transcriptional regulator
LDKDKVIGVLLVIGGIAGIVIYGLLLWNPWTGTLYTMTVLAVTAFVGVAVILGIVAWIGWTMATTPPPPPIEIEAPSEEKPSEGSKPGEAKSS